MVRYVKTVDNVESGHPISCMSKLGSSNRPAFMVGVYEDGSHVGEPYLKIYNNPIYSKSKEVTRLSLLDGHRIIHKNCDGRKEWNIDNSTLRALDSFLKQPSSLNSKYTNWQALLYLWNYETSIICDPTPAPYDSMLSAFVAGYFDTPENLNNSTYMKSDAKQPQFSV